MEREGVSGSERRLDALSQQSVEHGRYEVLLRRESTLFASWRSVSVTLVESPHEELLLLVRAQGRPQEAVNLTHSRISKKVAKADKYFSFGLIVPSKRKYLLACRTEPLILALYSRILTLRNEIRARHDLLAEGQDGPLMYDESQQGLEFEKCEEGREQVQCYSTNAETPKRTHQQRMPFTAEQDRERDFDLESFCTAMEDRTSLKQPQQQYHEQVREEQQYEPEVEVEARAVEVREALSEEETERLESEEGFRLLENLGEGRLLARGQEWGKVSMVVGTSLAARVLVEAFFHLELWNGRVKHFSVLSRIDAGIYLCKLELRRRGLFARPACAHLMAHCSLLQGDPLLVLRALPPQDFEPQPSHNWLGVSLWARVREGADSQRLLTVCARAQGEREFEEGLQLLRELRRFQLFLRTTGQLPPATLQWPVIHHQP